MAVIKPIGMPENDSERKAIRYFEEHLPPEYIVFHSLELLNRWGLPYEYDLIVVGEYAVYAVEVKGYRGLIKGNAREWELESGAIYKSPIPLANKKAKIVADRLRRHNFRLENIWVQSLIVITDDQAHICLNDDQANKVLHLKEVVAYILDPNRLPIRPKRITHFFSNLVGEAIFKQFRPLRRQHEIGDYRVLETIGKNNLYTTLLAEHRLLRTQGRFILKVYSFSIYVDKGIRRKQEEWVLRDANALHRLIGHTNIVRAYPPFPWQDNQIVLPLEWVNGYSLRGLLDSGDELGFSRKVDIIRQIGAALGHAHNHRVVHRDVRPGNIIISSQGTATLINFDCARVQGDKLQTIASRVGRRLNQRYVAPEVWQNARNASPASDQYALGTVCFELLTGQPPYDRIKEVSVAKRLPQRPTEINPNLDSGLDEVIGRMCAFKVTERYEDLSGALEDLAIIG